ncbi:unnamed protein product [Chrysoparadoxa australica]
MCRDAEPKNRTAGLDILGTLSEYVDEGVLPPTEVLAKVFSRGLDDVDMDTRVAALRAACAVLSDVTDASSIALCSGLIPKLLMVVGYVLERGDENVARDALQAMGTIAERQPALLKANLEHFSRVMLSLAASPVLEAATRHQALEFLVSFCEHAPGTARRAGRLLTDAMVPLIMLMLAQLEDQDSLEEWGKAIPNEGGSGEVDEGDEELSEMAEMALDRVSMALGGRAVLSTAMPMATQFLADADWRKRRAALLALALIGEGCKQEMRAQLAQVVPVILRCCQDPHPRVRYQLLYCLKFMSQDFAVSLEDEDEGVGFQEEFHKPVLQVLCSYFKEQMPRLQYELASSVASFCEPSQCSGDWIMDSSTAILEGLFNWLLNSPSIPVKQEALTAVGHVAQVLGPVFGQCYGTFAPIAHGLMSDASPETALLRGKAAEAFALMGAAVGREQFRADAHQVMQMLLATQEAGGFPPGDPQTPYVLMACARIAGVLKGEFTPYLGRVMPPLISAVKASHQIKIGDAESLTGKEDLAAQGYTAIECCVKGIGAQVFGVNTALMQEKEMACRTMFQYTEEMGTTLAPFAAEALASVLPNLGGANTVTVRNVSSAIVPRLLRLAWHGKVPETHAMLAAAVTSLCEVISGGSAQGTESLEPYCLAADALSESLKWWKQSHDAEGPRVDQGLACLELDSDAVSQVVRTLLAAAKESVERSCKRRAHMQQEWEDFDIEARAEMEEEEDWETDALTSAVDGIGWVIKTRKEAMLQQFMQELWPFNCHLLQDGQPDSLRGFGLCMTVDVLEHCGPQAQSIAPAFQQLLLRELETGKPDIQQTAAYGLGVQAAVGGSNFEPICADVVTVLLKIIQAAEVTEETAYARDNSISALLQVAIHWRAEVSRFMDVKELMRAILSWLPLTSDLIEAHDCHRRIVELAEARDPLLFGSDDSLSPMIAALLRALIVFQPREEEWRGAAAEEDDEAMWERQLVDKATRDRIVRMLTAK